MKKISRLSFIPFIFLLASCNTPIINPSVTKQEQVTYPSTIKTVNTPTSDSSITNSIQDKFLSEKLFTEKDIASVTIQAKSIDGTVYLVGLANDKAQFDRAVKIAFSVEGVKDVDTSQLLIANHQSESTVNEK